MQCAQVLLARTEALDEVEAAVEQRFAAALARERAELAKQARSLLCTRGSWLQRPSLVPQSLYATDRGRDGCACSACGGMGHGVVEHSWRQACLSMKGRALLTEQYPLARCTKRAPRRAPRRRRQPSSGWPRWTRRAARRGRPPCARPWRWASGGWALARCLACLFMCTFTTHSALDMPPSSYRACPPGVLAWSLCSAARAAGCCQGNSPPWTCLLHGGLPCHG